MATTSLSFLFMFLLISFSTATVSQPMQPDQVLFPNRCAERCGSLELPFPFHLNSSCGPPVPSFRLSCRNSSLLYLSLGPTDLRIISFLQASGSLLLDYSPNSSSSSSAACDLRWYSSVVNHVFDRSRFFSVTARNVLRLYDCEDSSICGNAGGCDPGVFRGRCEGDRGGCCYSLADGSAWKDGDGFEVFSEFGCRGFSSWIAPGSAARSGVQQRGIEMEWAVPKGYGNKTECAEGAVEVKATTVKDGVRCACGAGFLGDGFADGAGCFKSCDGGQSRAYKGDCCKGRLCKKKAVLFAGLLICLLCIAVVACYFLLRRPNKAIKWDPDSACLPKIFARACRTRVFTYQELNKATKGFVQDRTTIDLTDGTIHPGVLNDGSRVAVQRVRCETQRNLRQVLKRTEQLSQISHKNIARIIGWCMSSSYTLLIVHEFFPHGTLRELLQACRGNGSLNWYRRVNIATEIASALTHLHSELSPTIEQYGLKSNDIFI
ncbi:putative inactive receptor-like protein kinase [Iris pallida]|uniref:Inactive receptor-like protein kinase n=1 Tax=Iris pallida TaxID=29817 RepID=A0AAX6EM41_IRIPA|nr:putative inactive receptor-like protein kinase [Iris pallida]